MTSRDNVFNVFADKRFYAFVQWLQDTCTCTVILCCLLKRTSLTSIHELLKNLIVEHQVNITVLNSLWWQVCTDGVVSRLGDDKPVFLQRLQERKKKKENKRSIKEKPSPTQAKKSHYKHRLGITPSATSPTDNLSLASHVSSPNSPPVPSPRVCDHPLRLKWHSSGNQDLRGNHEVLGCLQTAPSSRKSEAGNFIIATLT